MNRIVCNRNILTAINDNINNITFAPTIRQQNGGIYFRKGAVIDRSKCCYVYNTIEG